MHIDNIIPLTAVGTFLLVFIILATIASVDYFRDK